MLVLRLLFGTLTPAGGVYVSKYSRYTWHRAGGLVRTTTRRCLRRGKEVMFLLVCVRVFGCLAIRFVNIYEPILVNFSRVGPGTNRLDFGDVNRRK